MHLRRSQPAGGAHIDNPFNASWALGYEKCAVTMKLESTKKKLLARKTANQKVEDQSRTGENV
jgi:hypothetical protein